MNFKSLCAKSWLSTADFCCYNSPPFENSLLHGITVKFEQNSIEPETAKSSPSQTKKVFIKTHGCQMNEYDSDRMLDLLKESQHAELVDDPADADLLLLNTCSIREKAQ